MKLFGYSKCFAKSASYAFEETTHGYHPNGLFNDNLEAAKQVAGCGYEINTTWGSKVFFSPLNIMVMFWFWNLCLFTQIEIIFLESR